MAIQVNDLKISDKARRREITLVVAGAVKTFTTPCIFAEPKRSSDLDHICEWDESFSPANLSGVVFPLTQARRIKAHKENAMEARRLDGKSVEEAYRRLMISMRELFYQNREGEAAFQAEKNTQCREGLDRLSKAAKNAQEKLDGLILRCGGQERLIEKCNERP